MQLLSGAPLDKQPFGRVSNLTGPSEGSGHRARIYFGQLMVFNIGQVERVVRTQVQRPPCLSVLPFSNGASAFASC